MAAVAVISLFCFESTLKAIEKTTSVEGLVTKIDHAAKTVVVKGADGTEHTMHLVGRTVVQGGQEAYKGAAGPHVVFREGPKLRCQNRAPMRLPRRSIISARMG